MGGVAPIAANGSSPIAYAWSMNPRNTEGSSARHFLYPLNPISTPGYVFTDKSGTEWPASYEGFLAYVDYDEPSEWGLTTGFRKIRGSDMVWAYFVKPDGTIRAAGRVREQPHWKHEWGRWAIWIDWDQALTERLGREPIHFEEYRQHVQQSAIEASATTTRLLRARLEGDQSQTQRKREAAVRFARREVESRLGQGDFRRELLRAYNNRCAVTGCSVVSLLEAAHIRGVRDGGDHSVTNGLLLRADIHSLFDVGMLWIDTDMRVCVDRRIPDPDYRKYHRVHLQLPSARSDQPRKAALRRHRLIHQR